MIDDHRPFPCSVIGVMSQILLWTTLALLLALVIAVRWYLIHPASTRPTRSVALLVLGDVGRSPRMMFHAQSFADHGFQTTLIGYQGSAILPSLRSMPNFHSVSIPVHLSALSRAPRVLFPLLAPIKVLLQSWSIWKILAWELETPPEFILVQNPPSIPTLVLAQLVCFTRGSKLIIDWHNLGFSILALKLGHNHPLVSVARKFESFFGRSAYAHLFVTDAMKSWLTREWKLEGLKIVLHDRSPEHFHPSDPMEVHQLFTRLSSSLPSYLHQLLPSDPTPTSSAQKSKLTPFTTYAAPSPIVTTASLPISVPVLRPDRPALVVSSTSWTPDEDFTILLDALSLYNQAAEARNSTVGSEPKMPKVLCVISGKGPGREAFERDAHDRRTKEGWNWVGVWCCWVEVEDYPKLLGSSDLGISLHSSSSALDLPMKIVDMFGCGLPVCSLGFACLDELVEDGKNGLVFSSGGQLASQMTNLLSGFPSSTDSGQLGHMRREIASRQHEWGSWRSSWDRLVRPIVVKGSRPS